MPQAPGAAGWGRAGKCQDAQDFLRQVTPTPSHCPRLSRAVLVLRRGPFSSYPGNQGKQGRLRHSKGGCCLPRSPNGPAPGDGAFLWPLMAIPCRLLVGCWRGKSVQPRGKKAYLRQTNVCGGGGAGQTPAASSAKRIPVPGQERQAGQRAAVRGRTRVQAGRLRSAWAVRLGPRRGPAVVRAMKACPRNLGPVQEVRRPFHRPGWQNHRVVWVGTPNVIQSSPTLQQAWPSSTRSAHPEGS